MSSFIKNLAGNSDAGTSTEWGGDDITILDDYFNDVNVSADIVNGTGAARINTVTRFRSTKFILRDSGNDHNYIFVTSNLTGDRNVTYPLLLADDIPVFEDHIATLSGKTLDATCIVDVAALPAAVVLTSETDVVTDLMLTNMAGFSVKGKATTGTGDPADITLSADTVLGRSGSGNVGGITIVTNHITNDNVTDAKLANMTGFSIKGKAGTGSGDPADITMAADTILGRSGSGDIDDITIVTNHIGNDQVTLAKIANIATASFLGRITASTGDPEVLTGTQATTLLDVFTSALKGLAPASGGGTTNFLRADGTWAAPPGGGGGDNVSVNGTAATDADFDDATPAAVGTGKNVKWQKDSGTPNNISAYVEPASASVVGVVNLTTQTFAGAKTFQDQTKINGLLVSEAVKTSNYTIVATDTVIRCDASSGDFTITLPTAVGIAGTEYTITRVDITNSANLVTVDPNGSQTIGGVDVWRLQAGEFIKIMSDGANWIAEAYTNPTLTYYYYVKGATNDRHYPAGFHSALGNPGTSTTSPTNNTLYALPFIVGKITKFDQISFNITTSQASQNARAGIYMDDGSYYPGALIFDTGSISTGTTGVKSTTITSTLQVFQAGLYWLAWETSATTCQIKTLSTNSAATIGSFGLDNSLTGNNGYGYSVAHTFGALPNPYTGGATILSSTPSASNPVPLITLRAI